MEVPQESPKIVVVNANKKSLVASIILTLFFGPLGLLYSSVSGGIIMIIVTLLISFPNMHYMGNYSHKYS
jgi:hypothetical protein